MTKSNSQTQARHVGIIMDGNGRWAVGRGRPRAFGHYEGTRAVRRIVEAAPERGIGTLTLYAFSSDNWKRGPAEVNALMRLLETFLRGETRNCIDNGVALSVIGRRDRLPPEVITAIEETEAATAHGRELHLRLAVDYSARHEIWRAARECDECDTSSPELLDRQVRGRAPGDAEVPDVDLLIRTGGEQRLSDFLLWECAYAELYFTPTMWPEFTVADFDAALRSFRARERRFGRVPGPAQPAAKAG